ncbi:MAG: hypothetical protein R3B96_10105 [Pirellulaceae bacterium]
MQARGRHSLGQTATPDRSFASSRLGLVLSHAISTTGIPLLTLLLGLVMLMLQRFTDATWLLSGFAIYELLMLGLVIGIARGVHQRLAESSEHREIAPPLPALLAALSIGIVVSDFVPVGGVRGDFRERRDLASDSLRHSSARTNSTIELRSVSA